MANERIDRRALLTGMGAATAGMVVGSVDLSAQAPAGGFQPARHPQDAWFDTLPGKHRVILDATSMDGAGDALQYAGNVYNANRTGYQLENGDHAVVVTLRHFATAYAFNNAMWAKYGKTFAGVPGFKPAKPNEVPASNPLNSGERPALDNLAKRGAHFAVCGLATRFFAGQIAGEGGDSAAVYKELEANTIPNAHIMAAGVIAITRAQEYGYSLIYVG